MKRFGLLSIVSLASLLTAAERETIRYPVEDFGSYTAGLWKGRNDMAAAVKPVEEAGNRAMRLSWDFTPCREAGMRFANMVMHRPLSGAVQSVLVRVKAGKAEQGAHVTLWIQDASGETYISRRTVDWEGWQTVEIPVAGLHPGWRSGDANGKQDLPLKLFGLAVESDKALVGQLVIDDIEVVAKATPEEALAFHINPEPYRTWGDEKQQLRLRVGNYAATPFPEVVGEVTVRDLYTDQQVGDARTVTLKPVPGKGEAMAEVPVSLLYGAYEAQVVFSAAGNPLRTVKAKLLHESQAFDPDLPDEALQAMAESTSFGGVMGFIEPELAGKLGARWIRFEGPNWANAEPEEGKWDFAGYVQGMKQWRQSGVGSVLLQTLYQCPPFRSTERLGEFARGYGTAMAGAALATKDLCSAFELGNEDNGPTKFAYTEIARHGAAGVRSRNAMALIANSGTAFVDVTWLEMQARRGLLDGIDVFCVHPYTNNSTPIYSASAAKFHIHEEIQKLNALVDRLGGMKFLWSTEFGWPNAKDSAGEAIRAELYPRHMLVGAGAGLDLHGLYTWQRDYGITDRPAEVSVHALLRFLRGHRFVAWLRRDDEVWAGVWEQSGVPRLAAWSPNGKGSFSVSVAAGASLQDLFGNEVRRFERPQTARLALGPAPVYLTGLKADVLTQAGRIRWQQETERLGACLRAVGHRSPLMGLGEPAFTVVGSRVLGERLLACLKDLPSPVLADQAAVAAVLRVHDAGLRYAGVYGYASTPDELAQRAVVLRNSLSAEAEADWDTPALRWLLVRDDRLAAQQKIAVSRERSRYARSVAQIRGVGLSVAESMALSSRGRCYSLWPYLFARKDGKEVETLTFVPGVPTDVQVRVSSYSAEARQCSVSLELPQGWTCEPVRWSPTVVAGGKAEGAFRIMAPSGAQSVPGIAAKLSCEGLPDVVLHFDDVKLLPAVGVEFQPVAGVPGTAPVPTTVYAREAKPVSGLLRILDAHGDGRALARQRVENVGQGRDAALGLALAKSASGVRALTAELYLDDGRRLSHTQDLEFVAMPQLAAAPEVDGKLDEWQHALPLRLDKAEYARGSYGGGWSPEDGSAETFLGWTPGFVHFAAKVRDQTFNQQHRNDSTWNHDSFQIIFAADVKAKWTEFALALSPDGPQIWSSAANGKLLDPAQIAVRLVPGGAIYEATIPVSALRGFNELAPGMTFRYGVALNDHDAVGSRKFLERFRGSIVHGKHVEDFGKIAVTGLVPTYEQQGKHAVLREDFEEYDAPGLPDAWQRLVSRLPKEDVEACGVRPGIGRNGSKALVLLNRVGHRPHHYVIFVRELKGLKPGAHYRLTAWVRSSGVENGNWLGICSDLWGNERFSYVQKAPTNDWQRVTLDFTAPAAGRCNVIIRNHSKTDGLFLDDLEVLSLD